MITHRRLRTGLCLVFVLLTLAASGQTRQQLIQQVPDGFTAAQWRVFGRAWSRQHPWLSIQLHSGEQFSGLLLHDERGQGFHLWTSPELPDFRLWDEHYRFVPYTEVTRINDLFVYTKNNLPGVLVAGALSGALAGFPFGVPEYVALAGMAIGGTVYLFQQAMELGSEPDLMFLMRSSGSSYYKDYRLSRRQLFADAMPDTTELKYQQLHEWAPGSEMMQEMFFEPLVQGYMGAGITFLPQAPTVTAAPYIETIIGGTVRHETVPVAIGAELGRVSATTNRASDEPLLQYTDVSGYLSYPIANFDPYGKGLLRVAPAAGVTYRILTYEFIGSGGNAIQQVAPILGAMLALRADYRIGHRASVWLRGQGKILPQVELPWPTPEFDPNILRAEDINTSGFTLNLGMAWYF